MQIVKVYVPSMGRGIFCTLRKRGMIYSYILQVYDVIRLLKQCIEDEGAGRQYHPLHDVSKTCRILDKNFEQSQDSWVKF